MYQDGVFECKRCEFYCIHRHPTSDLKCKHCGKIITQAEYSVWCEQNNPPLIPPIRMNSISGQIQPFEYMGWICPLCGIGNAPFNKNCDCTKPKENEGQILCG